MMKDIHEYKPSAFKDKTANKEYNELLGAVKNKPSVTTEGFYFTKNRNKLFRWQNGAQHWVALTLVQPSVNNGPRR